MKRSELRKQLRCSRLPAGSVQGVQRKLQIVPTHWHYIPVKNAATILSNNGMFWNFSSLRKMRKLHLCLSYGINPGYIPER